MDLAIPDPWPALVLVLGAYRLTRFLGWDDWPPIYRVRAWAIGERWVSGLEASVVGHISAVSYDEVEGDITMVGKLDPDAHAAVELVGLPGKQPPSEATDVRPAYDRPTLAHLVHCPFCLGWWVSLAVFAAWNVSAGWTLWLVAPFALSGAVGLVARNLDP